MVGSFGDIGCCGARPYGAYGVYGSEIDEAFLALSQVSDVGRSFLSTLSPIFGTMGSSASTRAIQEKIAREKAAGGIQAPSMPETMVTPAGQVIPFELAPEDKGLPSWVMPVAAVGGAVVLLAIIATATRRSAT